VEDDRGMRAGGDGRQRVDIYSIFLVELSSTRLGWRVGEHSFCRALCLPAVVDRGVEDHNHSFVRITYISPASALGGPAGTGGPPAALTGRAWR
jgi:hypothetical protein